MIIIGKRLAVIISFFSRKKQTTLAMNMPLINFPNPLTHEFTEGFRSANFFTTPATSSDSAAKCPLKSGETLIEAAFFPGHRRFGRLPWFVLIPAQFSNLRSCTFRNLSGKNGRKQILLLRLIKLPRPSSKTALKLNALTKAALETEDFIESYCAFHKAGDAHSIEVWIRPASSSADFTA